jgi:titin
MGGASSNSVGPSNVISGNTEGVLLFGSGTSQNTITGSNLGTNKQGIAALANAVGVIVAGGATGNRITGGGALGPGNLISGNTIGVLLTDPGTSGNVVQSNLVGPASDGQTALGNAALGNVVGVFIGPGASGNTVGGAITAGATPPSNTISGNAYGVVLAGTGASQNLVEGNLIGTVHDGTAALSNIDAGVLIAGGASANTVGGTAETAANVISGNGYGVLLTDPATTMNVVEGNDIGTNSAGTANVNNLFGIGIQAPSNTVGGTAAAAGNTIAFSLASGVVLVGNTTTGDSILSNSIYGNGGVGIDLGGDGPTANGSNPSSLPNDGQNFPVLTVVSGNSVTGTLSSTANASFTVQVFGAPPGWPYAEGETLVGSVNVTTDANGNATFSLAQPLPAGDVVCATASETSNGDTSEFSF